MREMHKRSITPGTAVLIGEHPTMQEALRLVDRIARSPIHTVLIYGETGTGKGMVARRLHDLSQRAGENFVGLNCAAIPGTLMESELFGHERGAFTGATTRKRGLIEIADGGTVFLDEIREMELSLQAKLLGLLDTQSFRPIGATTPTAVDVRFIAATNQILLGEVKKGLFREDLYYRLQVVAINLPALRDRGDDVFVLTEHFLRTFSALHGRVVEGMEPAVREIFRAYRWPGNVRELENLVERIFVLEDENRILARHIPARILREVDGGSAPPPAPSAASVPRPDTQDDPLPAGALDFRAKTESFQRALIEGALERCYYRIEPAASLLGMSRHALRHQIRKLGIRMPERAGQPAIPGA
jgi:transcriptional regulator with PAS, ATPase and Fis domain